MAHLTHRKLARRGEMPRERSIQRVLRAIRPVVASDQAMLGERRMMGTAPVRAVRHNVYTGEFGRRAQCSGSDHELDFPGLWWCEYV